MLHQALVEAGVAQMFGSDLTPVARPVLHEAEQVADRIRQMMGLADA
jgi:hypothetical protein